MGLIDSLFGPQLDEDQKEKLKQYKIEAERQAAIDAAQAKIDREAQIKAQKFADAKEKIYRKAAENSKPIGDKIRSAIINAAQNSNIHRTTPHEAIGATLGVIKKGYSKFVKERKAKGPFNYKERINNFNSFANNLDTYGNMLVGGNARKPIDFNSAINAEKGFNTFAKKKKHKR